jgi:hypothetical protein
MLGVDFFELVDIEVGNIVHQVLVLIFIDKGLLEIRLSAFNNFPVNTSGHLKVVS